MTKKILFLLKSILLVTGLALILTPIYLVVITSLKTLQEASQNFLAFPRQFFLGNFTELLARSKYWNHFANSLFITIVSVLLIIIVIPALSYAIARNFNKKFYRFTYFYFLLGIFVPFQVIMFPLVRQMTQLKMLNTYGLILLYVSFSVIRGVFLFVEYIRALPVTLEESAFIDGCSLLRAYAVIVVPMIQPMLATLVIMDALWIWNDFMLPLLILNKSRAFWTLPLFQYNFNTEFSFNFPMAFTAYLLSLIPITIVYIFSQKYIIEGLTAGAVKE